MEFISALRPVSWATRSRVFHFINKKKKSKQMRETSRSRSGGPSDALFQIGPLNAPGPDGFPARFFQRNWDVLREDVTLAVRKFFEEGVMPEGVNTTIIVLIPKKEAADDLKDFRPISLCNVVYKIISKCLANRIRPLLHDIIEPNQSAFIPGRMITDNAIIAFECLHAIQSGNENARKFCAYKLDLSKAYDRVEWNYLDGVMRKLGFNDKLINWTMQCVTCDLSSELEWCLAKSIQTNTWTSDKETHCLLISSYLWQMGCQLC